MITYLSPSIISNYHFRNFAPFISFRINCSGRINKLNFVVLIEIENQWSIRIRNHKPNSSATQAIAFTNAAIFSRLTIYIFIFSGYFSDRLTTGKNRQNTTAPIAQDIPSISIVEGAPIKCAKTPANKLPKGSMIVSEAMV